MELQIKSLSDYINEVIKRRKDFQYCKFRGHENVEYELLPSIARIKDHSDLLKTERMLIQSAKYTLPDLFNKAYNPLSLLALLQHYGIPTRLLDVTSNPLVALYFSCLKEENNGEVIVFKYNDEFIEYPIVNAIADTSKFVNDPETRLIEFYEDILEQSYFDDQRSKLRRIFDSNYNRERWIDECCSKILFVQSPEISLRQTLQQGQYILFNNKIRIEGEGMPRQYYFENRIELINKESDDIVCRFIIDKEYKNQILHDLSIIGFSKKTLFLDSPDKVCESLVNEIKGKCIDSNSVIRREKVYV